MSIGSLIKTSLYSIKAHKLRVFLTMIGIIIGISSTVTIKSIGDGLSEYITSSMEDSDSNKYNVYYKTEQDNPFMITGTQETFREYDVTDVKNIEGVTDVEVVTDSGSSEMVMGAVEYFDKRADLFLTYPKEDTPELAYGAWFQPNVENQTAIVITQDVAETLFGEGKAEESIGKALTYDGDLYEVIGVLKKDESAFGQMMPPFNFMPKDNLIKADETSLIISINVYVDPYYNKDDVLKEVTDLLNDNHADLEGEFAVYDASSSIQLITNIVGGITTFVTAITGIALFVGGVGVMNIMYVSVTERKREIGIRRAIGAKPRTILFQFLFEAVLVTGVGGVIGIVLGYLLGSVVSTFIPIDGFQAVLTAKTLFGSAFISVIVGIVFGIIPARNASKLDPIKAIYQ